MARTEVTARVTSYLSSQGVAFTITSGSRGPMHPQASVNHLISGAIDIVAANPRQNAIGLSTALGAQFMVIYEETRGGVTVQTPYVDGVQARVSISTAPTGTHIHIQKVRPR